MTTALLLTYAIPVLLFWLYSSYRLLSAGRSRAWHPDAADYLVLGLVGLLSSAAWPLLLPVYAAGWLLSPESHRALHRVRGAAGRFASGSARWRTVKQGM